MNNLRFEGLSFRCSPEAEPAARCFSAGLVLDGQDPGHVLTGLFSVGSDTLSHASSGQMALTRRCSTSESVSVRTFFTRLPPELTFACVLAFFFFGIVLRQGHSRDRQLKSKQNSSWFLLNTGY